jgi:hypothetical protein
MLENEENNKVFRRTIAFEEYPSITVNSNYSQPASRTIEPRRSLCGKIYYRG